MTKKEYTKNFKAVLTHRLDLLAQSKSKWSGDVVNIRCTAEQEKLSDFKRLLGYKVIWLDWIDNQTVDFTVKIC